MEPLHSVFTHTLFQRLLQTFVRPQKRKQPCLPLRAHSRATTNACMRPFRPQARDRRSASPAYGSLSARKEIWASFKRFSTGGAEAGARAPDGGALTRCEVRARSGRGSIFSHSPASCRLNDVMERQPAGGGAAGSCVHNEKAFDNLPKRTGGRNRTSWIS